MQHGKSLGSIFSILLFQKDKQMRLYFFRVFSVYDLQNLLLGPVTQGHFRHFNVQPFCQKPVAEYQSLISGVVK